MYVRNRTKLTAALSRGALREDLSIGVIAITAAYSLSSTGVALLDPAPDKAPTDPPDMSRHVIVRGCSVTAAGTIYGPATPPFVKPVSFKIGTETRRLAVFGERRWRADMFGEIVPTEALRFDSIPLSFDHAFGGFYELSPGLLPGTDLPHPGGKVAYPLNDHGVGFYPDKASATGGKLPSIELADQLLSKWTDRPEPGGFSPCPELPALRHLRLQRSVPVVPAREVLTTDATRDILLDGLLLGAHHAPGQLIFDAVPKGTSIELTGVGKDPVRFDLPYPPARVSTRRDKDRTELSAVCRSIHVDADLRVVRCVHAYEFAYNETTGPSWIVIEPSETAS